MEKKSGIWFWVFLAIVIFVIYCISMQRPYCQTLDGKAVDANTIDAIKKEAISRIYDNRARGGTERYSTPSLFPTDTAVADDGSSVPGLDGRKDANDDNKIKPAWVPDDDQQYIPKPDQEDPQPIGYALFANGDRAPSDPYATVVSEEYQLGTGDHILVVMWGRVDQEFELVIDRSGRVFIPKAGPVMITGMTLADARKAITSRLRSIYSGFELTVTLGQLRTFRIYVFGEVQRPGAYTVGAAATLVDALYRAGGPNKRGTLRQVRLVRGDQTTHIDLYDFLLTGLRTSDPRLAAGDVVFVDITGPRAVARGQVKRPGIYELHGPTTLGEFIELAGGFEADAYRERIMIDRLQDSDGRQLIDVDLSGKDLSRARYPIAAAPLQRDADTSPSGGRFSQMLPTGNDPTITTVRLDGEMSLNPGNLGWLTPVLDGDDVSVFSMIEARPNVVWLEGWVNHPGAFERTEGTTIGSLINWGEQLKMGVYMRRADLIRPNPDGSEQLIAVDLESIVDQVNGADMPLQDGDRLTVYPQYAVERPLEIFIEGEIRYPGRYTLYEAMRLSDLVFRSGNTKRTALTTDVEIVRRDPDGTTRTLTCNLKDALEKGDLTQDILLKDGDHVFVRPDPLAGSHRLVHVGGEVRFPGRYALLNPDESFYEVLMRAGGLTPRAFARGTLFIRSEISDEMKRQNYSQILINAQPLLQDSTGRMYRNDLFEFDPERMARIVLDVPQVLKDKGGDGDIVMRPGDRIFVPAEPSGIQVVGAVASPGTIGFREKWRVSDYLARAGGTTNSSDKRQIRIVKADGQVVEIGGKNHRVELGDAIFIPPRVKRQTDWFKTITQTVSFVGGVATTFMVVHSLGN